jgi:carboxyl-terminal processing protease
MMSEHSRKPSVANTGCRCVLLFPLLLSGAASDRAGLDTGREGKAHNGDLSRVAPADPKVVKEFAATVTEAVDILAQYHVKNNLNQGELVVWAIRGLYQGVRETIPHDLALKLARAPRMKEAERVVLLMEVRRLLGQRQALEKYRDIDLAFKGIFDRLEPGFRHPSWQQVLAEHRWIFCGGPYPVGIGLELSLDRQSRMPRVVTPRRGSPAHRAGVRTGDLVLSITDVPRPGDDFPPETFQTTGQPLDQVERALIGRAGSKVKLAVLRDDRTKPLTFIIQRGRSPEETVFGACRRADLSWDFLLNRQMGIGYVRITSITLHTTEDIRQAVRDLRKQGLKGLILDLRFSPGGLFLGSCRIADLFVGDGLLFSVHGRNLVDEAKGRLQGSQLDFPMVCLVNGKTRMGSEALAACLQDHQRVLIVGEQTPGDVAIRNIQNVKGGLFSFAAFVLGRPSGRNLSRITTSGRQNEDWGVRPDRGLEVRLSDREREKLSRRLDALRILPVPGETVQIDPRPEADRQLAAAVEYLRRQRPASLGRLLELK